MKGKETDWERMEPHLFEHVALRLAVFVAMPVRLWTSRKRNGCKTISLGENFSSLSVQENERN